MDSNDESLRAEPEYANVYRDYLLWINVEVDFKPVDSVVWLVIQLQTALKQVQSFMYTLPVRDLKLASKGF